MNQHLIFAPGGGYGDTNGRNAGEVLTSDPEKLSGGF